MDDGHLRHLFHEAFDPEAVGPGAFRQAIDALPERRGGTPGWLPAAAGALVAALVVTLMVLPHVRPHSSPAAFRPAQPRGAALSPPGTMTRIAVLARSQIGLAGGNGVIARTTDGGRTWAPVYRGRAQVWDLQWLDRRTVYAATNAGLWLSTDAGVRWNTLNPRRDLIRLDIVDASEGFAIAGAPAPAGNASDDVALAGGRLLRTTDGGRTFTPVATPAGEVQWVQIVDKDQGYLAVGGRVWLTRDGGRSWRPQSAAGPATSQGAQLGFTGGARHGFALFRGPDGAQLYHTDDGGASWRLESAAGPGTVTIGGSSPAGRLPDGLLSQLVVTGDHSAGLLATSPLARTSFCSSGDDGRTWACTALGFAGASAGQLAVHGSGAWLAVDLGAPGPRGTALAYSDDGGRTWHRAAF